MHLQPVIQPPPPTTRRCKPPPPGVAPTTHPRSSSHAHKRSSVTACWHRSTCGCPLPSGWSFLLSRGIAATPRAIQGYSHPGSPICSRTQTHKYTRPPPPIRAQCRGYHCHPRPLAIQTPHPHWTPCLLERRAECQGREGGRVGREGRDGESRHEGMTTYLGLGLGLCELLLLGLNLGHVLCQGALVHAVRVLPRQACMGFSFQVSSSAACTRVSDSSRPTLGLRAGHQTRAREHAASLSL